MLINQLKAYIFDNHIVITISMILQYIDNHNLIYRICFVRLNRPRTNSHRNKTMKNKTFYQDDTTTRHSKTRKKRIEGVDE